MRLALTLSSVNLPFGGIIVETGLDLIPVRMPVYAPHGAAGAGGQARETNLDIARGRGCDVSISLPLADRVCGVQYLSVRYRAVIRSRLGERGYRD